MTRKKLERFWAILKSGDILVYGTRSEAQAGNLPIFGIDVRVAEMKLLKALGKGRIIPVRLVREEESPINGYGTHFPVLAAAVNRTSGPVLEFGAGHYSTSLLHVLCSSSKRRLVTVDLDAKWLEQFSYLKTDWHELVVPPRQDWDKFMIPEENAWSVVLIDHRPAKRRAVDIRRMKNRAEFIVVHDSDVRTYHFDQVLDEFTYRYDWNRYKPATSVVSMVRNFTL